MRQAGRYLPEYRATREKAGDFLTLCKSPQLACQVTLQPLARFPLDAAIVFSDILTIPDAMGLELSIIENQGPRFQHPVRSKSDIEKLPLPDPETDLRYVTDTIRLVLEELDGKVPLIGFSGSPWTLATYMVEGSGSKDFAQTKRLIFDDPESAHKLLDLLARSVIEYLNAQIAAGTSAVMIFDTWGGVLSPRDYQLFSLQYMQQIVDELKPGPNGQPVPSILFTKGGGQWLERMADTGCTALGIDWTTDISVARQRVGERVGLQGNMDPNILYASPDRIREEVDTILTSFGSGSGHVFNLGHGIHPGIDPENVAVLVETVHKQSERFHQD